jgi:thiol-disulfide isomerase/thioredoxin
MNRRGWIAGAAGAAAAAAGAGSYVWRERGAGDTGFEPLWALRFPQPGGGELVMAERRGKPLLLNFWATWCPPCLKEMPDLDRFAREYGGRGWQVVGLAVDGPTPVREFLQRTPVTFAIGLAGFEGTDLSRALGNAQGALPFTAVFDARGRIVQRKLGQTDYPELVRWAAST